MVAYAKDNIKDTILNLRLDHHFDASIVIGMSSFREKRDTYLSFDRQNPGAVIEMKPEQSWGSLILVWLWIEEFHMALHLASCLIYRDMSRAEPLRIPEPGLASLHRIGPINCGQMEAVVHGSVVRGWFASAG